VVKKIRMDLKPKGAFCKRKFRLDFFAGIRKVGERSSFKRGIMNKVW
jgi:hypothetical protein